MTTTTSTNMAEIVEGLRHRLGGDATGSGPAQHASGAWPADPDVTGERGSARHAKDGNPVMQMVAELRRPEVAVPAVAARAAGGGANAGVVNDGAPPGRSAPVDPDPGSAGVECGRDYSARQSSGARTPGTSRKPHVTRAPRTPAPTSVSRAPTAAATGAVSGDASTSAT